MKGDVDGVVTYYVGRHYHKEVNDGVDTVRKFYTAGSMQVAVRTISGGQDTLTWILTDHLGSTQVTANANGSKASELKYTAFGEKRPDSGDTTATKYQYTGQLSQMEEIGLYYYMARWMDPVTAHFVSADTVIPGASDAVAFDRYAYLNNNPMNGTDPTGHWVETVFDIISLGMTINDIRNEGFTVMNTISLVTDVAAVVLPIVPAGVSQAIRATKYASKAINAVDTVTDTAQVISKADDVTDLMRAQDELNDLAKMVGDICSFSPKTQVSTDEGTESIAEIKVGDKVLAWNEAEGKLDYYEVTATFSHEDEVLTELVMDGEGIETTPEHPFYVEGKGWTTAGELQAGDQVRQADGTTGMVWSRWNIRKLQSMYNLTVATAHTFFVGEGQWLVHNACPKSIQKHHLIPNSLENHPLVQLAKESGWKHNGAYNIMELPANQFIAKQSGLPVHAYNKAHRAYNIRVQTLLDDMFDTTNSMGWSSSQAKQALFNTARELRWNIVDTRKLIVR